MGIGGSLGGKRGGGVVWGLKASRPPCNFGGCVDGFRGSQLKSAEGSRAGSAGCSAVNWPCPAQCPKQEGCAVPRPPNSELQRALDWMSPPKTCESTAETCNVSGFVSRRRRRRRLQLRAVLGEDDDQWPISAELCRKACARRENWDDGKQPPTTSHTQMWSKHAENSTPKNRPISPIQPRVIGKPRF